MQLTKNVRHCKIFKEYRKHQNIKTPWMFKERIIREMAQVSRLWIRNYRPSLRYYTSTLRPVLLNINGTGSINASCIEWSGNIDHAATAEHKKSDDLRIIPFFSPCDHFLFSVQFFYFFSVTLLSFTSSPFSCLLFPHYHNHNHNNNNNIHHRPMFLVLLLLLLLNCLGPHRFAYRVWHDKNE